MEQTHNYFGTNTNSAGHYFWLLKGESQSNSQLNFRDFPFNPENFTKSDKWGWKPKGSVEFHVIDGYTIMAISGSPIDKRDGCKSVFFFKESLSKYELVSKIKSIPAAMKIINQMPFVVDYEGLQDPKP